jgi:hypothetical protein
LLNISSTTEPIRRRIGSVVELTFNSHLCFSIDPDWPFHILVEELLSLPSLFVVVVVIFV